MTTTVLTVQFDYNEADDYAILLEVMKYSLFKNVPNVQMTMVLAPPPPYIVTRLPIGFTTNTKKLEYWVSAIDKAQNGDRLIFMDCDMLLIGDITKGFGEGDFDIAYTYRTGVRFPMNGGVVFVNVNERSRKFVHLWKEVNDQMFGDYVFHKPWRHKYAGMNQAAFGYIYEVLDHGCNLLGVPCAKYNVCNEDWDKIKKGATCLHIKSGLRKLCLAWARGKNIDKLYRTDMEVAFSYWKQNYLDMKEWQDNARERQTV